MQKGFAPIIILVGILILGAFGGVYYFFKIRTPEQKPCTKEAKVCPDGTTVGRTGPKCEFTPCPLSKPSASQEETTNWQTYRNDLYNFEVKYQNNWSLEIPQQFNTNDTNDFSFYLKPKKPSINRLIVLTTQILKNNQAEYYFNVCCQKLDKESLDKKVIYLSGPTGLGGMIEWSYVMGNQKQLVRFGFGVGMRDDSPPLPKPEDVQKELEDLEIILSTFKFLK